MEIFTYKDYCNYKKIKEQRAKQKVVEKANCVCEDEAYYEYCQYENKHTINNEHDKIFRKILDDPQEVAELINTALKLKKKIKAEELQKYTSSFVTEKLENRECDVVYRMQDRDLFFLIEHQTKVDYMMAYRILTYEYGIIQSAINSEKLNKKDYKLPNVISIVLYTGKNKWSAENDIRMKQVQIEGYNDGALAKYNVVDINDYQNEELLNKQTMLSKVMIIEKTRYTDELSIYLQKIVEEVNNKGEIYTTEQKELLIAILDLTLRRKIGNNKVEGLIKKLKKEENEMLAVLTMIDRENRRIFEHGVKEGKKRAIKETKLEDAKKMLEEKIPLETIVKVTGLTKEEILK